MTLVEETVCKGCGQKIKIFEMQIIGGPHKGERVHLKYGCKCEDIRIAKESWEIHQRAKLQTVKDYFERYSLINPRLMQATLEGYQPKNDSQAEAKKMVEKYIQIFSRENPKNILFYGGFGVGKSHLAKVITDGVMKKGYTTVFISVPKLLRKIRSTYNRDSQISEDDVFNVLESIDLLVLDDIGAEKRSDWTDERLFDVIDSRQGKSTIYTTNYTPDELLELFGERNFSRIVNEDTVLIEIQGENHRLADLEI